MVWQFSQRRQLDNTLANFVLFTCVTHNLWREKNIPLRTTRDLCWETKQTKEVYCLCQVTAQSVKNIALNIRVKTVTFFLCGHFKAKLCMHLERGTVEQIILSKDIQLLVISPAVSSSLLCRELEQRLNNARQPEVVLFHSWAVV